MKMTNQDHAAPWFLRCFGKQPTVKMEVPPGPRIMFTLLGDEGAHAPGCEMDGEVWSQLPREVLVHCVLPRLPQVSQHRFQAVCKEWLYLLSSHSFPHAPSGQPLLCAFRKLGPGRGLLPHLDRKKMHPVALPSSQAEEEEEEVEVVAQDGFLSVQGAVVVFVNPLTNSWCRVDSLMHFGELWSARANAEVWKDGTVKVYACGSIQMWQGSINVSGNTQRWRSAAPFCRFLARAGSVVCKGTLYHYDATHEGLFVYNIEAGGGQWHDAVAHRLGSGSIKFRLVERGGKVYLVGAVCQRGGGGGDLSYHVSRLDESLMAWEPLTVMPGEMAKHVLLLFDGSPPHTFEVCAAGECVLLIFRTKSLVCILSFNLVTETWQPCFQNEDPRRLAMFDGFFEPRFHLHFHKGSKLRRKLFHS